MYIASDIYMSIIFFGMSFKTSSLHSVKFFTQQLQNNIGLLANKVFNSAPSMSKQIAKCKLYFTPEKNSLSNYYSNIHIY